MSSRPEQNSRARLEVMNGHGEREGHNLIILQGGQMIVGKTRKKPSILCVTQLVNFNHFMILIEILFLFATVMNSINNISHVFRLPSTEGKSNVLFPTGSI